MEIFYKILQNNHNNKEINIILQINQNLLFLFKVLEDSLASFVSQD